MLFPFKKAKNPFNLFPINDKRNIKEQQPHSQKRKEFTSPKELSKIKIKQFLLHKTNSPPNKSKPIHFRLTTTTPNHIKHKSLLDPKQQSFFTLTTSTLSSSKTSSYFPTVPTTKRKTRNKSYSNNLCLSHTYKKYSNTNEVLTNVENTCTNIQNEITFIKKRTIEPSKVNAIENIHEIINKDIKLYAKEEAKINDASIISRNMVIKSTYASKVSEKFAYNAENIVYEMFNKEYFIKKRKMDENKQIRRNMQRKRMTLRLLTDSYINNYNNTINKCYNILNKQLCK